MPKDHIYWRAYFSLMLINSYDFVFDYGSWPYGDKPSWICTSRELECLNGANLHVVSSVEQIINEIRDHGRMHYITSEKAPDLFFHRIAHKHANSTLKDAFPRWKAKIEEKLV